MKKRPLNLNILFLLALPVLHSCTSGTGRNSESGHASAASTPRLSCINTKVEVPSGEQVYDYMDNGYHYTGTASFGADSLYLWSYIKDTTGADQYYYVDVTAAALADIDSSNTTASEYDLAMTDGSKKHETVFFVKSKNEAPVFKNRTYTCLSGDQHFETFNIHTVNITTYSIAVSRKMVAQIREKMRSRLH